MKAAGSAIAFVLLAIVGLLAGSVAGGILGTIATASMGSGPSLRIALVATTVVLDIGAALGVYFALRANVGAYLKVFSVAAGVGALGALTICSGILFSA